MKKIRWLTSLLLCAAMCTTTLGSAVSVAAEEEYYEEEYYDDGEDSGEEEYYGEEDSSGEEDSGEEESWFVQDPTVDTNEIKDWPQGDTVDSDAAIVMEASTGAILYGKHIDVQKYPASITKVMTVLLALENGNLEDTVKFSHYAVYSIEYGSAHLGLTEGEELTLEQCLYGIMLASANEISNAVAEHIGGSVEEFADMMNAKAKELGCVNTHFVNPNGLHDDDHYTCAYDMALITQAALQYDKFREIIHTDEYHYPPTNLVKEDRYFVNHHSMLMEESYDGIIGGKTGYTDEAYNTLVTCVERDGMTLISVVMHAPGIESEYGDTRTILDYGYENFEDVELDSAVQAKVNQTINGVEDEEELGRIREADLMQEPFVLPEKTMVTVPKGTDLSTLTATWDFDSKQIHYAYQGQEVGSTAFEYTGNWAPETESEILTEAVTETETELQTEIGNQIDEQEGMTGTIRKYVIYFKDGIQVINKLIAGNDILAVLVGAVLLLFFIPLLILSINRNRRYKKMMKLRAKEEKIRKYLEQEIERKSAAQIEAEIRARDLEFQLEMEKKKNRAYQNNQEQDQIMNEESKNEEE